MAYVLSSLSGNLISAASAGYAPTNSGDVSSIASAYQVVSATATQLNAGTAYLTSVNEAPISAARAGNAANASLANSAWYDGTGRLISSLPDEATVYGIASAYAESAASSKLDESATADFYSTSNPSGFITGVDLSNYATTAYVDSSISSFVDSAYVDSQVSGKEDKLMFGYDDSAISSINGSALAGGGGKQVVTSLQYTTSESGTIVGYTTGDRAGYGNKVFSADYYPDQGWYNYQSSTALAAVRFTSWDSNITGYTVYPFELFMVPYGATNNGNINTISSVVSYMNNYGQFNDTSDFRIATGMAMLSGNTAILDFRVTSSPFNTQYGPPMWGTAGGLVLDENENSKPVFSIVYGGGYEEGQCAAIEIGLKVLDFGAITTVSAVSGINNLGIAGGAGGGVDSATVSAIASSYAESAASGKLDSTAQVVSSIDYAGSMISEDVYVSQLNGSFLIANEAYSAHDWINASSKLDESATADFYTTSNPSGFIDSAYVDSAVSSKADSSALSSYVPYSSLEYNTASAISGINGSALAAGSTYSAGEGIDITDDVISVEAPVDIVAGPGIVIDNPDGNTLRVSTDEDYETVLWSGSPTNSVTLSENMNNFECIDVYERWDNANANATVHRIYMEGKTTAVINFSIGANTWYLVVQKLDLNGTSLSVNSVHSIHGSSYTSTDIIHESNTTLLKNTIIKVVGVHRIQGGS